jgi:hypothetical protein
MGFVDVALNCAALSKFSGDLHSAIEWIITQTKQETPNTSNTQHANAQSFPSAQRQPQQAQPPSRQPQQQQQTPASFDFFSNMADSQPQQQPPQQQQQQPRAAPVAAQNPVDLFQVNQPVQQSNDAGLLDFLIAPPRALTQQQPQQQGLNSNSNAQQSQDLAAVFSDTGKCQAKPWCS